MQAIKLTFLFTLTSVIAGCANTQEPGIVSKEWARNTRQLNIFPIFPPKERFYPGDVYIFPFVSPRMVDKVPSRFFTIKPIRFTRFDVSDLLKAEQAIPTMPETNDWNTQAISKRLGEIVNHPSSEARQNGVVAFPGYSFASVSDVSLGLGTVSSSIAQKLGFASSSERKVTFSVPYAEVISLDFSSAMDKFLLYKSSVDGYETSKLQYLKGQMQLLIENLLNESKNKYEITPGIVFVTDVYYARSIDVTITSLDGYSASSSVAFKKYTELTDEKEKLVTKLNLLTEDNKASITQLNKNKEGTTGQANIESGSSGDSSSGASGSNKTEIESLSSQIDKLDSQLSVLSQSVSPDTLGFTGNITRVSGNTITLNQVFKYPVAIGYNGITMPVQDFIELKVKHIPVPNVIPLQKQTDSIQSNNTPPEQRGEHLNANASVQHSIPKTTVTTDWGKLTGGNILYPTSGVIKSEVINNILQSTQDDTKGK